jgi:polyribonucleotide nucleotidyltransferase
LRAYQGTHERALEQARRRLHILGEMLGAEIEGRSPYAPRIFTIYIKPDKIREVIGQAARSSAA